MRNKAKGGQKIRASATKTDDQEKTANNRGREVLSPPNEKIIKEERNDYCVLFIFFKKITYQMVYDAYNPSPWPNPLSTPYPSTVYICHLTLNLLIFCNFRSVQSASGS
jgi:hypothetical protein